MHDVRCDDSIECCVTETNHGLGASVHSIPTKICLYTKAFSGNKEYDIQC